MLQITTRLKKRITDIKRILNVSERKRFVVLILLNVLLSIADIGSIALVFLVLNIYSGKPVTWLLPILKQLNITPAIFCAGYIFNIDFYFEKYSRIFYNQSAVQVYFRCCFKACGKKFVALF